MRRTRKGMMNLLKLNCKIEKTQNKEVMRLLENISFGQLKQILLFVAWIGRFDHCVFSGAKAGVYLEASIRMDGDKIVVFYGTAPMRGEVYLVGLDAFFAELQDVTPRGLLTLAAYIVRKRVMDNFPTTCPLCVAKAKMLIGTSAPIFIDDKQLVGVAQYLDLFEQDRLLIGRAAAEICCQNASRSADGETIAAGPVYDELKKILTLDAAEF